MTRNPGQLPERIDTSHAHFTESIIDPETDEPAVFGGGGEQTIRLLGPYHIAFDTPNITTRLEVGPALSAGTFVMSAWAVPDATDPEWDADDGNPRLSIGITIAGGEWDRLLIYYPNSGVYEEMPTDYQQGEGGNGPAPVFFRRLGFVQTGTGHLYVSAFDSSGNPPTQGAADVYALIAEPA